MVASSISSPEIVNYCDCTKNSICNCYEERELSVSEGFTNFNSAEKSLEETSEVASSSRLISDYNAVSWRDSFSLIILLITNLLNYMDRYTIAGVLGDIQKEFQITNSQAGLLQTSFIISYMILSPIFGYMGDRFNRKLVMGWGILFWSFVTLAGSFVPIDKFWVFLSLRGLVGVGEASYSIVAPTIIADLFKGQQRSKALGIFYFAIPVGSGLGYIVGANVASAFQSWRYAFRVTPGLGVLCAIAVMFVVREPARGASEGGTHISKTSYLSDIKYLCKNKSFMLSSFGFTCVAFVTGALALWLPIYLQYSIRVQGRFSIEKVVALYFGIITCFAGFFGVFLGTLVSGIWRKSNPKADPLICAIGMISASPLIYAVFYLSRTNMNATWAMIFIGETMLCLNWAIVTDILLYTVIPTRRSTAEAVQIILQHALGDAVSPYFVGLLSDYIKPNYEERGEIPAQFLALKYSLYSTCFVCVVGSGFFFATALFVSKDKEKCDKVIKGGQSDTEEVAGMLQPAANDNQGIDISTNVA